ncbi:MAG: hydantoinase B/oxoprolinase family protein [Terracidiphilus sp.]
MARRLAYEDKDDRSVEFAIFQSAVHSIAEEMGAALRRTALSPNIKERRDYSCAVFDGRGRAIAMGDHMPVHLGSMPMSVQAAIAVIEFAPGDIAILNDPYAGGTHLPDITMVLPVFLDGGTAPVFYVANRAHHADVGGKFAGSMGPATTIEDEGIRIAPVRIVRGGVVEREVLDWILRSVRTPLEREGDLEAQIEARAAWANSGCCNWRRSTGWKSWRHGARICSIIRSGWCGQS